MNRKAGSTAKPSKAGFAAILCLALLPALSIAARSGPVSRHRVIIFVWDGLRPDSVSERDTPNLASLRDATGVNFSDNHSTYPTFTMMNAASLATGGFPGRTGFYGNTLYQRGPEGRDAQREPVNFDRPVFTEDYAILDDLNAYYRGKGSALLRIETLFAAAQKAHLKTAAIGKSGPAYLQDYRRGGLILDENMVWPLSLAQGLQAAGMHLPRSAQNAHVDPSTGFSELKLAADNGDPIVGDPPSRLADGVTVDPRAVVGSPNDSGNSYLLSAYLDYVLPKERPDLSLIWLRTPDSTEHAYGPGSPAYRQGLHSQDFFLGRLLQQLDTLGLRDSTDVIVMSDHGHSLVAGDASVFPLRALSSDGSIDLTASGNGYPVSGDVRSADILSLQGIPHVYDGRGCLYDPLHSGILADGKPAYPPKNDAGGAVCQGTVNDKPSKDGLYSSPAYRIPVVLPHDATIIATNGGSDYFYLPDGDGARLQAIVRILQSRKGYGAIFVNDRFCSLPACANIPGVLPMSLVNLESPAGATPDLIVSFDFDADASNAVNATVPGTEYESFSNSWGMHGSFSPRDVHNTLIASGPDFKKGFVDTLPSGNVDVAPTVAHLLGLPLLTAQGRILHEALKGDTSPAPSVKLDTLSPPAPATGLAIQNPTDPRGTDTDPAASRYAFTVQIKRLTEAQGKSYLYFDQAKATRD